MGGWKRNSPGNGPWRAVYPGIMSSSDELDYSRAALSRS